MELDRYLHNQKLFVNALREARDEVRAARDRMRTSQESPSSPPDTDVAVQEILARLSTRQEEQQRKESVQEAMEFVNMNHRRIVEILSELRSSLKGLDAILKRQPSFNVKRLLGAPVVLLRDQSGKPGAN